jgi:hypothetical protein
MNFEYHRKVLNQTLADHPIVVQALTMIGPVEQAMKDLVAGEITITEYVGKISAYDEFMYRHAKSKPQKSNPINTLQNKKYSTWRELKWTPVFELIRLEVTKAWEQKNPNSPKLKLIQNLEVIETIYSNGYMAPKDVDGGLALEIKVNKKNILIPVAIVEDKGGRACSTCVNGVNAQALRMKQSFPNAKFIFLTDNESNVAKTKGAEIADKIDLFVIERGNNMVAQEYPPLKADRWQSVYDGLVTRLSSMSADDFLNYNVINSNSVGSLRSKIDTTGIYWNC